MMKQAKNMVVQLKQLQIRLSSQKYQAPRNCVNLSAVGAGGARASLRSACDDQLRIIGCAE
jgi:hypothetical protein